jgi:hypothetical protein
LHAATSTRNGRRGLPQGLVTGGYQPPAISLAIRPQLAIWVTSIRMRRFSDSSICHSDLSGGIKSQKSRQKASTVAA